MSQRLAGNTGRGIVTFFLLTWLLSWGLWVSTALSGADINTTAWFMPYFVGGFAPSVVGVWLLYRTTSRREERRDFWARVINFKRISPGWYLVILLLIPALAGASVMLDALVTGTPPTLLTLDNIAANPVLAVLLVLVGIVMGPLSEELGWRGFALDRLQSRMGVLAASLLLGAVWVVWHMPLFLIRGTSQYEHGLGSPFFWVFVGVGVPLSIWMTWAYNHNGRSILSAVLLHFAFNFTLNLVYPITEMAFLYLVVLMSLVALGMVLFVKPWEPDATA